MRFPVRKFGALPRAEQAQVQGAGDLVARVAAPVARTIDALIGTDLEHCAACDRRREILNRLFSGRR